MPSVHEHLSAQFYHWEQRGRGWQVFGEPVVPEPPFLPFPGHYLPETKSVDDGRRPTLLGSFVRRLSRKLSTEPLPAPPDIVSDEEPEPELLVRDPLVELLTSLPAKLDIPRELFEQLLSSLSLCHEPLAFELLGMPNRITTQFAACPTDVPLVRRQLQAYFPEAVFQTQEGALRRAWESGTGEQILAVEFGLEREFMFPLATGKLDPFIGIIGALSELQPADLGLFQVLFQPVEHNWSESIMRSVTHSDGRPFFVNSPELARAAENKVARPLYGAVVRVLVRTERFERTLQVARDLAGSLRVFAHPSGNALIPLSNDEYAFEDHIQDVLLRQSRRPGMLLNSDELMGFVHLPSSAVRSPVLQRETTKTKAAPESVRQARGVLLGHNVHAGVSVPVRLTPDQRTRHTHIIGASGKGKSTLLFNLIREDIENGDGIAVLDPHGDLVDKVLAIIPSGRVKDVVLVDPSDEGFSVGFNILSAHSDLEKTLLASDLVSVFKRLSTSWGDQMGSVLNNAILVFLESKQGGTLSDLRRFLIEPGYRAEVLKTIDDAELVYYWQSTFPQLSGNKSIGSVLTRLETFLAPKPIRFMVAQRANRLDFAGIMDSGKIFLAKLSQGMLGKENSFLLGTLLVAKFQQIAMSRQGQAVTERRHFWLYIDEFHNFITPSMAEILTGARKYRIGLTLAHQELRQLDRDSEVASAVLSMAGTRICFGLGDDDARKLGQGFSFFDARDLQNLETGHAICRIEKANQDFNISIPLAEDPGASQAGATRQAVIAASRSRYATPRSEIEAAERSRLAVGLRQPTPPEPSTTRAPETTPRPVEKPSPPPLPAPPSTAVPPEPAKPRPEVYEEAGQHSLIKEKIGAEAESLDYSISYEEHFPAVQARADLVLRRGKQTIACQVTVTTPVNYEIESVQKLLKADLTHVAVVSVNRRKLNQIEQGLSEAHSLSARIGFYSPSEFTSKLLAWATDDPEGGIVERGKPRKHHLNLNAAHLTQAERKENEKKWLEEIKQAMKR